MELHIVLPVVLALVACMPLQAAMRRALANRQLLRDLASPDEQVRSRAREQLPRRFARRDLPYLYDAIRRPYPDDQDQFSGTRYLLLNALWHVHDRTTAAFIAEVYPALPDSQEIRFSALRALTEINTPESLSLLLDILTEQRPDLRHSYYPLFLPLYSDMRHADVLFPRLLLMAEDARYRAQVYGLAAHYRNHGKVADAVLAVYREQVLSDWRDATATRTAVEPGCDEAADALSLLEVLADCMAAFPGDREVTGILRRAVSDPQAGIALYSVLSLLRMGEEVSPAEVECVAARPAARLQLYEFLEETGQRQLFPPAFLTQYHFAEADLVRWLCFPSELGRPPSEIELIEAREERLGGKRGRIYLCKFRDGDEDGWMVGLSGPQPIDPGAVSTSGRATFSHFHKLDAMSIDEHFGSFLKR